jgi:hypothetical protein
MNTGTQADAIDLRNLHDLHNELSPLLEIVETLIDVAMDYEGDSPDHYGRRQVINELLQAQAAQLRSRLDDLCCAYRNEVHP